MQGTPLWLDSALHFVSTAALTLLVVLNACFVAALLVRRDRRFVDRWTKPLVVVDAALLVAVVGTPVVAYALTLGAKGVTSVASVMAGFKSAK